MLHRPMSRALLAGAAFCMLSAGDGPARADILVETGYVPASSGVFATSYLLPTSYVPTSSILSVGEVYTTSATYVPTYRTYRYRPRRIVERTTYLSSPSYSVAPTSYLLPTSYLVPTSYAVPTSYVTPTTYLSPTTYVTPTTYLSPTTYVTPTSYLIDTGLVTTSASAVCCETAPSAPVQATATRPSSGNNPIRSVPSNPDPSERRPSGAVDDGMNSNVTPPVTVPPTGPRASVPPRDSTGLAQPGPIEGGTPPAPTPPGTPSGPGPGAVGGDVQLPPPGQTGGAPRSDETFRESRRPTYEVRNVLRGKVLSYDSGRPEEGVTVILSSRTNSFTDRPTMTDADGEFKVSLPDGDWTIKVKMPSGSIYPVGRDYLTATSGRITDGAGRSVREFVITR